MAVDLGFVAAHNVLVRQAPCAQIPARLLETCPYWLEYWITMSL